MSAVGLDISSDDSLLGSSCEESGGEPVVLQQQLRQQPEKAKRVCFSEFKP